MAGDLRICERDGAPLVFTFEYPGAEYVCVLCGATEGVLGLRAETTPELARRLSDATEGYERDYAERHGQRFVASPRVGEDGVEVPTCGSCGTRPEDGLILVGGKPPGWFSRVVDDATEYACSRACIQDGLVLPW